MPQPFSAPESMNGVAAFRPARIDLAEREQPTLAVLVGFADVPRPVRERDEKPDHPDRQPQQSFLSDHRDDTTVVAQARFELAISGL